MGGEIFILLGAVFHWKAVRNIVFRIIHLAAVVLVALESLAGILCPLTEWEYNLRRLAGQRVNEDITFIGRLIRSIIFYDLPQWFFTVLYIGFGVLVAATFFLISPRRKGKSLKKE